MWKNLILLGVIATVVLGLAWPQNVKPDEEAGGVFFVAEIPANIMLADAMAPYMTAESRWVLTVTGITPVEHCRRNCNDGCAGEGVEETTCCFTVTNGTCACCCQDGKGSCDFCVNICAPPPATN